MDIRRIAGLFAIAFICLFTSACFSIEQEIFLNADGSGEMVLHVSLPDFPEKMRQAQPGSNKDPKEALAQFKKEAVGQLPPTVKLKEIKEVNQNGALGFYAVLQFKNIKDLEPILASLGKESMKEGEATARPFSQWALQVERKERATQYMQRVFFDVSEPEKKSAPAKSAEAQQADPQADAFSKELEEQLKPMFFSLIKLRFVLHAPAAITASNADIVMNSNTAVWNCSLAAFLKNNKPIEMKASF